jgi:hypothetical protein
MSGFGFRVQDLAEWWRSFKPPATTGPVVNLEEICHDFYDRQLLSGTPTEDARESFFDSLEQTIARADFAFAQYVEEEEFRFELTALRLELFGLALYHAVHHDRERLCLRELAATEKYLKERDELRLWEAMGVYNQGIVQNAFRRRHVERRARGGRLSTRLELNERWLPRGVSHTCISRYVNRGESDDSWRTGQALTALMQTLTRRLGVPLNAQAQLRMHSLVYLFHDEPYERLRNLRLV